MPSPTASGTTSAAPQTHAARKRLWPTASGTMAKQRGTSGSDQLGPLTSIRLFAALHLFLFHVYELHRLGRENPQAFHEWRLELDVLDSFPAWSVNVLYHGYCSTGLFFLLSGFVLAYLYLDARGRMTTNRATFWFARLARIYPLHLVVLVLIAPAMLDAPAGLREPAFLGVPVSQAAYTAIGGVLSVTLLQAWFPEYALSWNFPTWALSTVVFFYLMFPWLAARFAGLSPRALWRLLGLLPILSLMPSAAYLAAGGDEAPMSFWNEFVLRLPLFWLPNFAMGMLLSRAAGICRHNANQAGSPEGRFVAWGDLAAACLFLVFIFPDAQIGRVLRLPAGISPHLFLRHGLAAPLYLVLIHDLARGQGVLARALSWRVFRIFGETSFSIFILQMPVMFVGASLLSRVPMPSLARLMLLVAMTLLVAMCSTRLFERPVANWLKRRFAV
jgi:peptidoglycan/LPS O-acetylase OafA/YrhL